MHSRVLLALRRRGLLQLVDDTAESGDLVREPRLLLLRRFSQLAVLVTYRGELIHLAIELVAQAVPLRLHHLLSLIEPVQKGLQREVGVRLNVTNLRAERAHHHVTLRSEDGDRGRVGVREGGLVQLHLIASLGRLHLERLCCSNHPRERFRRSHQQGTRCDHAVVVAGICVGGVRTRVISARGSGRRPR